MHHQIFFANENYQQNYFNGLTSKRTLDGCSYIRKDGVLRVPINIEDCREYNYVFYQNDPYDSKIYYAFITGMEYANDGTTFLKIRTDVVQTYLSAMTSSMTSKKQFVEREIVATDTPFTYTYPEGLETGEYVHNATAPKTRYHESDLDDCVVVVAVSDISPLGLPYTETQALGVYGGTPSGFWYLAIEARNRARLTLLVGLYDNKAKGDAIQFMFLAPKTLFGSNQEYLKEVTSTYGGISVSYYLVLSSLTSLEVTTLTMGKPTSLNGYTPRNKKLLSYPYCYFIGTNRGGSAYDYQYEDFSSTIKFNVYGSLAVGCSVMAIPTGYKNITSIMGGFDYAIQLAKFPSISWSSDVYTNWLTSNAVNIANTQEFSQARLNLNQASNTIQTATDAAAAVTNLLTLNLGGATSSAGAVGQDILNYQKNQLAYDETIANLNAEKYQHALMPRQGKGNANVGDVQYASGMIEFALIPMCIKTEYAKIIDDYFDMFGYQVNSLKTLNFTSRPTHQYFKVKNAYFDGMPMEAAQELRQIFETGITFWHTVAHFGDYSISNVKT